VRSRLGPLLMYYHGAIAVKSGLWFPCSTRSVGTIPISISRSTTVSTETRPNCPNYCRPGSNLLFTYRKSGFKESRTDEPSV
jgi:hypothetical protein